MTAYEYLFTLIVFVVVYVTAYLRGKSEGAKPLTELKPGREYLVEAVMATTIVGSNVAERLVVSWHVDYGHYEWRIAVLERGRWEKRPSVGDRIKGRRLKYGGGMVYDVVSPTHASGIQS